jgi:SP family facilitated glucose transporter-like MFS transporter 8
MGIVAIQQFTGINAVCMYASAIFETQNNSSALSAAMAGIQVVFAAFTPLLVERFRRIALFLWGAVICSIGHLLAFIGFNEDNNTARNWVLNVGILLFAGTFNATYGMLT